MSDTPTFRLTFAGFLTVRLMGWDYNDKHYSYHGRKLNNAVKRLCADGGPSDANVQELVCWGQAAHDWAELESRDSTLQATPLTEGKHGDEAGS